MSCASNNVSKIKAFGTVSKATKKAFKFMQVWYADIMQSLTFQKEVIYRFCGFFA